MQFQLTRVVLNDCQQTFSGGGRPNEQETDTIGSVTVRLLRDGKTVEDTMRAGSGFREEPAEIGRLFVGQNGAALHGGQPF